MVVTFYHINVLSLKDNPLITLTIYRFQKNNQVKVTHHLIREMIKIIVYLFYIWEVGTGK